MKKIFLFIVFVFTAVIFLASCSSKSVIPSKGASGNVGGIGSPDAGNPDTGSPDTGSPDTGSPDTGTQPNVFLAAVGNKTYSYRVLLTVHRYKFSADGKLLAYTMQTDGSAETPPTSYTYDADIDATSANFKLAGGTHKFIVTDSNNKLYTGSVTEANYRGYNGTPPPPPPFQDFVKGRVYKSGSKTYTFSDDGNSVEWHDGMLTKTTYTYVETRASSSDSVQSVYKNGALYYITEAKANSSQVRMGTGGALGAILPGGTWYNLN